MKKLYYLMANGYDMVVSVDKDNNCRYLTETEEFPFDPRYNCAAYNFLKTIEDDSSWESDLSYEELLGKEVRVKEDIRIMATLEKEL